MLHYILYNPVVVWHVVASSESSVIYNVVLFCPSLAGVVEALREGVGPADEAGTDRIHLVRRGVAHVERVEADPLFNLN